MLKQRVTVDWRHVILPDQMKIVRITARFATFCFRFTTLLGDGYLAYGVCQFFRHEFGHIGIRANAFRMFFVRHAGQR